MLNEISVEIIRKCPNNCLHCSSFSNSDCQEIMPLEKFKEVVQDAASLGANTICLSGGEPFLHNDIVEMVKFLHINRLNCYIYTSGIVFDNFGNYSSIPEKLLKSLSGYVTKLIFNIEAGTEKTYDRIMRTKDCYKKMQHSVIVANKYNIITEAHFVPTKLNVSEIDKVIELCNDLKISKLSFLRLVVHGRALINKKELLLSENEYKSLKEKLREIESKSRDLSIRIGVPLSDSKSCHKCEAARGKLNIKYDGNVYPCEVFKNFSFEHSLNGLKPASIYNDSLKQIYNNSEYLAQVRKVYDDFFEQNKYESCLGQYLMDIEKEEN